MFDLAVISGKGGTGKTLVATTLSAYLEWDYVDCDVEAPNGAYLLHPTWEATYDVAMPMPKIDAKKCNRCGACVRFCRFNALALSLKEPMFFPELCHGCMGCVFVCEQEAIKRSARKIGVARQGKTENRRIWEGCLDLTEPIAPPVIHGVKLLSKNGNGRVLDGPPGASCNLIETLKGIDYALLVAEPTRFGIHDFKATVEVLKRLGIPAGVVINRSFGEEEDLRAYIQRKGVSLLGSIPFSERIAYAYSQGDFPTLVAEMKPYLEEWGEKILEAGGRAKS